MSNTTSDSQPGNGEIQVQVPLDVAVTSPTHLVTRHTHLLGILQVEIDSRPFFLSLTTSGVFYQWPIILAAMAMCVPMFILFSPVLIPLLILVLLGLAGVSIGGRLVTTADFVRLWFFEHVKRYLSSARLGSNEVHTSTNETSRSDILHASENQNSPAIILQEATELEEGSADAIIQDTTDSEQSSGTGDALVQETKDSEKISEPAIAHDAVMNETASAHNEEITCVPLEEDPSMESAPDHEFETK